MFKSQKEVYKLRKQYPTGTKVKCIQMYDLFAVPSGTLGVVEFVDDIGQIHCKWNNGSSLALNVDEDRFEIVKEEDNCKCLKCEMLDRIPVFVVDFKPNTPFGSERGHWEDKFHCKKTGKEADKVVELIAESNCSNII